MGECIHTDATFTGQAHAVLVVSTSSVEIRASYLLPIKTTLCIRMTRSLNWTIKEESKCNMAVLAYLIYNYNVSQHALLKLP